MSNIIENKTVKVIGLVVAVMLLGMAFVAVLPGKASAQTVESLTAQINQLLSLIASLQAQLAGLGGGATTASVCPYTWSRNLTVGSSGDDVMKLQKFLNASADTQVAASGAGSAGNETSTFGPATKGAVVKFQNKYASETLSPIGLSAGTGYFGALSRAKANSVCSGGAVSTPSTPTTPGTPVVVPAGSGLTVTKNPTQPANSLAPGSANRVPFTKVDLTASADGDVVVNSLVIERQGIAADTSFTGIVLLNEDGTIIGIEKTLNSSHQATIGTDFTVKAGTTKTVIVGGNMDTTSNLSGESGEVPSLAVVAVNTAATVHGTFPIVGASHTVNSSLSIGSVTIQRGSLDPGSNQTKEVGTTAYLFSGVKLTAGSAEDLTFKSIRWYQSGSATADDLSKVVVIVDGTEYPTTVDGRFYTAVFPDGGIPIKKGFSKDVSVKGDIIGGSNRTVDFDVERRTDIHLVGNTYGYGILLPFDSAAAATDGADVNNANNPYYDAAQVTISVGTLNISSWSAGVPAQNVAVNLNNQPIAGFSFDVKGEPISIASLAFNFTIDDSNNSQANLGLADLTNVTLVDSNGSVLAGPVDGAGATANHGTITLTDTVTFPVGITNVMLKGKLGTDFVTDNTLQASTTPSTDFTTVTGQVTGNTITPAPASAVSGSTQTVKAGAFAVSVSAQPTSRTVISGAKAFEFARYIFDATQSGEDVRVTTIPLYYDTSGTRTDLTNCKLYDGTATNATALNTGSNVLNPTTSDTASSTSITFDGTGLILSKGTSKTLSLRCDIKTGVTALYWWGIDGGATYTGASGITSGQTINETFTDANGQQMTAAASGSFTVANDTSVLFRAVQAGTADVILAKYRFDAGASEDVTLKQIALALGNTASNTTNDLLGQKVTIWNGSTQVGQAQFGLGVSLDNATSTILSPSVTIPRSGSVTLTIKGDLAAQDVNSSAGAFGAVFSVNYDGDNNGLNGNYATGVDSGVTISGTSADTAANAVKIYRGLITVEDVTTTSSLAAGTDLYKIKLTASAGRDVTLHALTFNLSAVGLSEVSGIQLIGPSGAVNATGFATTTNTTAAQSTDATHEKVRITFDDAAVDRILQAGVSKTFALRASNVSTLTSANTETVSIRLMTDTAEPADVQENGFYDADAHMSTVAEVNNSASTTDRFVWSPNSTSTLAAEAASNSATDWTNGYGLPGYPTVGQDMATRVFTH
ncbi:hypothetical protein HY468_05090 [Candidatus Roizmanbacteria bacterium]|nr:hypothetical protein [Candidatus Roizmanbacteria bacterium]